MKEFPIPDKEKEYANLDQELRNCKSSKKDLMKDTTVPEKEKEYNTLIKEIKDCERPNSKTTSPKISSTKITSTNAHTRTLEMIAQNTMVMNELWKSQHEILKRQQEFLHRALDIQERYMPKKPNSK